MTGNHFLLLGDAFLAEEKFKALQAEIQKKVGGQVSLVSHHLGDVEFDNVLKEARTLSFLATTQIFHLKEAHVLKAAELESLAAYLDNPTETTYLIFQSSLPEKSKKLQNLFTKKKQQVLTMDSRSARSVGGRLIRDKLRAHGKKMSGQALSRLEQQMAEVPMFLESVLDQLIEYAGESVEITEEMVEQFEENWLETDVFRLTDALASRNLSQAIVYLKQIVGGDLNEIIPLLGLLHWQMRRFWMAKVMLEAGVSQSVVMQKCKVYGKQAPFFTRQLKQFSRAKLESILEGLYQLDHKMKTGRIDAPTALESWVVETTT